MVPPLPQGGVLRSKPPTVRGVPELPDQSRQSLELGRARSNIAARRTVRNQDVVTRASVRELVHTGDAHIRGASRARPTIARVPTPPGRPGHRLVQFLAKRRLALP